MFRNMRRAWWSLWILIVSFLFSLLSPWLVNNKPLVLSYQGNVYFPAFTFYPETTFGGQYLTEADYPALMKTAQFEENADWYVMPPIPHSYSRPALDQPGTPPHPPSADHWLGTDNTGRDVLSRIIWGYRNCMLFALAVTVLTAIFGIIIGGIQGYLGGWADLIAQRLIEIWASLPYLYIVILVGTIYGRDIGILIGITALFSWIGLSYYMRGEFFKTKNNTYVTAARALGAGHRRIIFRQILPNAIGPAITLLPFALVSGINALTALDFLGFGLQPPAASWGEMLQQGLIHLKNAPWLTFSAVTALFLTLLMATFIGEGVRAAFDPKSSSKLA